MPTNEDIDNMNDSDSGEQSGGSENHPTSAREFSFKLDTAELSREISRGVQEGFRGMLQQNQQQRPDPEEVEVEITDEDREDTGRLIGKAVHNAMIPLKRQMKELTNFGISKLGDLTHQVTVQALPYYKDFKDEIDAGIAQLPANLRADAATVRVVYNNVLASHVDDIANRRMEEQKRQLLQGDDLSAPGEHNTRSARKGGDNKVPTPAELGFDDDQIAEIEQRGGPDRFARVVSGGRYNNFAEYAAAHVKMTSLPKGNRGRTIPFKRTDPKSSAPA